MRRILGNVLIVLGGLYADAWIRFMEDWFVAKAIPAQGVRGPMAGSLSWMPFGFGMFTTFAAAVLVGWVIVARAPYAWAITLGLLESLRWYASLLRFGKPIHFAAGTPPLWAAVAAVLAFCGVVVGFKWRSPDAGSPSQETAFTNGGSSSARAVERSPDSLSVSLAEVDIVCRS